MLSAVSLAPLGEKVILAIRLRGQIRWMPLLMGELKSESRGLELPLAFRFQSTTAPMSNTPRGRLNK